MVLHFYMLQKNRLHKILHIIVLKQVNFFLSLKLYLAPHIPSTANTHDCYSNLFFFLQSLISRGKMWLELIDQQGHSVISEMSLQQSTLT